MFYNQRKLSNGFWHSSKGTFTPFIDRCFVVLAGFHITVLQYYFRGKKLLGIIPSSYREGFPPPTVSVKSIPSSRNPVKIPSADTLPAEQVDLWHHYLIPPHLPSQVDWCLGVLPGAPSLGWTRGSYAQPLHISIIQRGSEHCYNAEKLIMFISASCWGPSAEGDLVRIEQHYMKWNPKTRGRISKHTGLLAKARALIHSCRYKYPHVHMFLKHTHAQRPYKYTVTRNAHKHTYWHVHKQCLWGMQLCSVGSWPEQKNIMITRETTVGCKAFRHTSIYTETLQDWNGYAMQWDRVD